MKQSYAHRATRGFSATFDGAAARAFDEDQEATREINCVDKTTRLAIGGNARRSGEASAPFAAGDVVLGRYEVQRSLGRDGGAMSYLARHVVTDRVVAIRVLDGTASRDARTLERLRRDARAIGRIRSDHVIAVHDVGAEPGSPAMIVTDHLDGETMERALAKGALGFELARLFGAQMLAGLNEAHAVGIVHGNLTPRSVMIEPTAANGPRVKLIDVGLSMFADRPEIDLECAGVPLGTVGYMSPERLIGSTVAPDACDDLYAVGVMLFAMLTGLRPFQADNEAAELNNVLTRPALRVSMVLGNEVPRALERFMDRALAADRDDRFQSANEMRLALFVAFDEAVGPRPINSASYEDAITIVRRAPEIARPISAPAAIPPRLDADLLEEEVVALPVVEVRAESKPATRSVPPPAPLAALESSRARRSSVPPPPPPAAMRHVVLSPPPMTESDWLDEVMEIDCVSVSDAVFPVTEPPITVELMVDDDGDFVIPPLTEQRRLASLQS